MNIKLVKNQTCPEAGGGAAPRQGAGGRAPSGDAGEPDKQTTRTHKLITTRKQTQ